MRLLPPQAVATHEAIAGAGDDLVQARRSDDDLDTSLGTTGHEVSPLRYRVIAPVSRRQRRQYRKQKKL